MASNIPVFDENNQNKLNAAYYTDDNERKDGFVSGQPIRSNIMNTVLNITTKAVSAILEAITNSKEINSDSDKQDIVDYVKYGLTKYIDNGIKISGNNTNTVALQVGNETTKSVIINDVNHATNADNTTNINTLTNNDTEDNDHIKFTIGDKSFEKTINSVQNATNATNATNVNTLTNNDTNDNANVRFTIGDKSFSKTVNNVNHATGADLATNSNRLNNMVISTNMVRVNNFIPYVDSNGLISIGSSISFRKDMSSGNLLLSPAGDVSIPNGTSRPLIIPVPTTGTDRLVLKSELDDINVDIRELNSTSFLTESRIILVKIGSLIILSGYFNIASGSSSARINIPSSYVPDNYAQIGIAYSAGGESSISYMTSSGILLFNNLSNKVHVLSTTMWTI